MKKSQFTSQFLQDKFFLCGSSQLKYGTFKTLYARLGIPLP